MPRGRRQAKEDADINQGALILALAATAFVSGCATQAPYSSGQYDRGYSSDPYYRNSGYDDRNYRGYDSYPANRSTNAPAPSSGVGSYLPQAAGAVAGGLLGAQVGKGNGRTAAAAVGAAAGTTVGGNMGGTSSCR